MSGGVIQGVFLRRQVCTDIIFIILSLSSLSGLRFTLMKSAAENDVDINSFNSAALLN